MHGAVIVGPTIEETTMRAVFLEKAARIQLMATSVGKPNPYTPEQLDTIQRDYRSSLADDLEAHLKIQLQVSPRFSPPVA